MAFLPLNGTMNTWKDKISRLFYEFPLLARNDVDSSHACPISKSPLMQALPVANDEPALQKRSIFSSFILHLLPPCSDVVQTVPPRVSPSRSNSRSRKSSSFASKNDSFANSGDDKPKICIEFSNAAEAIEKLSSSKTDEPVIPRLTEETAFLTPDLYGFLQSCLPNIVKGCQWVLLYSTMKHGISLQTLIRRGATFTGPCILVLGDMQGAVFGGLLDCPLKPTVKRKYQGTNQAFVFTTLYGKPRVFRATGANRFYYLLSNDILAFGGGGSFAFCLEEDLLRGTSGASETYGNLCLAHSEEFELKNVELWAFTHAVRSS